MKITNIIHPRFISTVAAALLVSGLELFPASESFAISFGQGGEFPWTSPLIQTNGAAHPVNTVGGQVMRLVNDADCSNNQCVANGSAFFINPYVIGTNSDFESRFTFQITSSQSDLSLRSDGLAFVIGTSPTALGGSGGALGYGGSTGSTPISPSVIVEFDIHQNVFPNGLPTGNSDPSDSHVALMTNGDETKHLTYRNTPLKMDNGDTWEALIRYFGQGDLLIVNLQDLNSPGSSVNFSSNIDIANTLGCGSAGCVNSYFGFTAATGAGWANHDILSWSLQVPEPGSLTLFAVGLSALGFLR